MFFFFFLLLVISGNWSTVLVLIFLRLASSVLRDVQTFVIHTEMRADIASLTHLCCKWLDVILDSESERMTRLQTTLPLPLATEAWRCSLSLGVVSPASS